MKKSFSLLFFVVASFLSHTVFAQTKTPYQQRKEFLVFQLLKDIGSSPATIKKYAAGGTVGSILFFGDITQKLLNTQNGVLALQRYKSEMKKAESLKNSIDRKRDEDKRLAQQRKNKIQTQTAGKAKQETEKQSIPKTKEEIEKENEDRAREEFESSDYYKLGIEIKKDYENWAQKSEFEKTIDCENRINTESSKMFSQICFNKVRNKISIYDSSYTDRSEYPIEIELGDYDADKEQFSAKLRATKDYYYAKRNIADATIDIPMNEAKSFKEDFSTSLHKLSVNTNDWYFADNNLLPKKITIKREDTNKTYILIPQLDTIQKIIFTTENLNIKNINVVFDYNKEALIIFENKEKKNYEKKKKKKKRKKRKKKNYGKKKKKRKMKGKNLK